MPEILPSKIGGFLPRDSPVSSVHESRPLGKKEMLLPFKVWRKRHCSFQNPTQLPSGEHVQASIFDFLPRDIHVSTIQLNRHILNKMNAPEM
jgi:hypothetical protein